MLRCYKKVVSGVIMPASAGQGSAVTYASPSRSPGRWRRRSKRRSQARHHICRREVLDSLMVSSVTLELEALLLGSPFFVAKGYHENGAQIGMKV
jgi:hypothetical protein